MPSSQAVEQYYDDFADRVQLRSFVRLNRRLEAIKRLCDTHIPIGASVLEIGCGTGIVSRHLLERVRSLVAVDISPRNIEIASQFARSPKTEFKVVDVVRDARSALDKACYDVILLADVVEHIPLSEHRQLFETLESLLSRRGKLILTYPSPAYQQYLTDHDPAKLQIIDESVHVRDLLSYTSKVTLTFFATHDIPGTGQYVHCVLETADDFHDVPPSFMSRVWYRARSVVWMVRNSLFLRKIRRSGG